MTWPELPPYEQWRATCDTLHAHTQVLGKLAVKLAPAEPQLQHAALRLTARGWETLPLPAPDRSGSLVVLLDLRVHEAVVEHSGGRTVPAVFALGAPRGRQQAFPLVVPDRVGAHGGPGCELPDRQRLGDLAGVHDGNGKPWTALQVQPRRASCWPAFRVGLRTEGP